MTILYHRPLTTEFSAAFDLLEPYMSTWNKYLLPGTFKPIDILPALRSWPKWMPWNKQLDSVKAVQWNAFGGVYDDFEAHIEDRKGCFMDLMRERRQEFGFETKEDLV